MKNSMSSKKKESLPFTGEYNQNNHLPLLLPEATGNAAKNRKGSAYPLCMSREQRQALQLSSFTSTAASPRPSHRPSRPRRKDSSCNTSVSVGSATGWTGLMSNYSDVKTDVQRALHMCSRYPTMKVRGTAFENSLHLSHRQSTPSAASSLLASPKLSTIIQNTELPGRSPAASISIIPDSSAVLKEAFDDSQTGDQLRGADRSLNRSTHIMGSSMVQLASAMKRAAMWETVVATALAQKSLEERFRRERLRHALEKYLLPRLLFNKRTTGAYFIARPRSSRQQLTSLSVEEGADLDPSRPTTTAADERPQGSYLKENDAFFESLNNSVLLQSLADTMTRQRYLPGDIMARAGEPSQRAMFFLISGKCEFRDDGRATDFNTTHPQLSKTVVDEGRPGSGTVNDVEPAVPRVTREVLKAGGSFGGIFGGCAVFTGNYRAISQCIVWRLQCEDFERIFVPFADRVMIEKYKEAMRAHHFWWLRHHYTPSKIYSSMPIYRMMTHSPFKYAADFEPVVKVRGELLFSQGSAAGDVFCLLEGTVRRRTNGPDGLYTSGVEQLIGTNSFSAINVAGRYLLLGEEPHLVPGAQPYTCIVSSRAALLYRISGENFVSALLDYPSLFADMRKKLIDQRLANMRLDPACLAKVPLLQPFPSSVREGLIRHAKPRIFSRSQPLCDPAQHLAEIFIIVEGSVRDPRSFGHKPVRPLPTPPPSDENSSDDDDSRLADGLRFNLGNRKAAFGREKHGKGKGGGPLAKRHLDVPAERKFTTNPSSPTRKMMSEETDDSRVWSFSFDGAALEKVFATPERVLPAKEEEPSSPVVVYPNESSELNPPLPLQPATHFLCTIGGTWEGLFLDKWPNGWETTTTVGAWAIPTLQIRLAFNGCAKQDQAAILTSLRQRQRLEQSLSVVPHTKLPPMSVYAQHSEAGHVLSVPANRPVASATSSTSKTSRNNRRIGSGGGSNGYNSTDGSPQKVDSGSGAASRRARRKTESDGAPSVQRGYSGDAAAPSAYTAGFVPSTSTSPARRAGKPTATVSAAAMAAAKQTTLQPKRTVVLSTASLTSAMRPLGSAAVELLGGPPVASAQTDTKEAVQAARNRARTHIKPAPKVVVLPPIDPAVVAAYKGNLEAEDPLLLRIVRDPTAQTGSRAQPPQTFPVASTWPLLTPPRDRWFQAVPSYEPLPGTAEGSGIQAAPPVFSPNSTLLASLGHGKSHGKTLDAHVNYFTNSSPTATGWRTAEENTGSASTSPYRSPSKEKTYAPAAVPKRHALVL